MIKMYSWSFPIKLGLRQAMIACHSISLILSSHIVESHENRETPHFPSMNKPNHPVNSSGKLHQQQLKNAKFRNRLSGKLL